MAESLGNVKRFRKDFSRLQKISEIPNLLDIQTSSYGKFLQKDVPPDERADTGLQGVFSSVFPIKDFSGTASLEFVRYSLEEPKYDVLECRQRGMTYSAPFKVTIRLVVWEKNEKTGTETIRDVKEQEVYFGEVPLMNDSGTFIINGTERVIVSQLHRSPGVFFDHDKGKTHSSGKFLFSARIIPYRGSWIDFEFDSKDILYVRIDRRRKMPATVLLKALEYSDEEVLNRYYAENYKHETIVVISGKVQKRVDLALLKGQTATADIKLPGGEIVTKKGKRITSVHVKTIRSARLKYIPIDEDGVIGKYAATDIVNTKTGEVVCECSREITQEIYDAIRESGIKEFTILHTDTQYINQSLLETLNVDKVRTPLEAKIMIYQRMRPGDPPTKETAENLFHSLFFDPDRYDLSKVGRVKMNYKLKMTEDADKQILSREDILAVVFYLLNLKDGRGNIDDIDHLGNRRVRPVGELVENQYRIGLVRMERAIRERMSLQEIETQMPYDLINAKPVSAVIKEFFGSSQLSQFMDQTNPLSEVTHKRRLSALGPGGLTRERAGFEVRDVHTTHYGRICPVETPEGPNIGLIASLATYARVNDFGFIETPYRKVEGKIVTANVVHLTALEEEEFAIAQANAPLVAGRFKNEMVNSRKQGNFQLIDRDSIQFMDVSPQQLVSVAASLIPFLENDDANRALMGSNMMRQAVPLMKTKAPLIGTGAEKIVANDSGVTMVARRGGTVESIDAGRVVIKVNEKERNINDTGVDIYNLIKYQRSNQNTCINQKPIVVKGEKVNKGQALADGPATQEGELALGQNIVVAFMPWGGYNYEDSILISEKLIKDDVFTSIHVEVLECVSRDTKLGKEEITRDIPNVGEEMLRNLDESGVIRVGAEVKPGDILVGKITPKGETQLSPEEKLLRAIFGEKAGDVRDTSRTVPPGVVGTIIDAKVFSRKGVDKDERSREIEDIEIAKIMQDQEDEIRIIKETAHNRVCMKIQGLTLGADLPITRRKAIDKGTKLTSDVLDQIPFECMRDISLKGKTDLEQEVFQMVTNIEEQIDLIRAVFEQKISRVKKSDELPPGVIKMVKVYVAIKRKLSVGDKMAGRHGNKGVLSRILPEEDMPYLEDGTTVQMILNPLGVPSRMNVGQILEIHLGWAAKGLGQKIQDFIDKQYGPDKIRELIKKIYRSERFDQLLDNSSDEEVLKYAELIKDGVFMQTPVFDGAPEEEIHQTLELADLPSSGQTILFDGRTGEPFYSDITVGVMYMLKLHHLVDDKIHARSIGPYSLVTQQPLGGKAQFGGQRLGEMEVWAMEAYGAAYTLQEFLTVKSDDVAGRTRMYEAIVKGENTLEPGLPESFNVLVRELMSLGLMVEMVEVNTEEEEFPIGLTEKDASAPEVAP